MKNEDPLFHGTSTWVQPLLLTAVGRGVVDSSLNEPAGPVTTSSDPAETVAPETGDPDGSTTFPKRVDEVSVVVVAPAIVGDTVEAPKATELDDTDASDVESVPSTPEHAETTRVNVARIARNRVGLTRAWYVLNPA